MSADQDNGGAAFPLAHDIQPDAGSVRAIRANDGMSLRDYFAAKAMVSLWTALEWQPTDVLPSDRTLSLFDEVAHDSYSMADAMLKARKGTK